MTNKLIYAAVLLLLSACADRLKIEPEGILTEEQVYNSAPTSEMVLGGVYYDYMTAAVGNKYMYGDLTADNMMISTGATSLDYNAPVIGTGEDFWTDLYAVINEANNVIEKIPVYGQYEQSLMDQYVAEAKFLRAICYFDLLKFYGDGALTGQLEGLCVPLQLESYDGSSVDTYVARSTNGEVYAQIIQDLTEAVGYLPDKYSASDEKAYRATISSANALLARVYLYKGDYAKAVEAADQVKAPLTSGGTTYDLESDLRVVFPTDPNVDEKKFSKEDIFSLPITLNQSLTYSTSSNRGKHNITYNASSRWVGQDLIDAFAVYTDHRKLQLLYQGFDSSGEVIAGFDEAGNQLDETLTTFKFTSSGEENVPMIRLAEVYLTKAEALVRDHGLDEEAVGLLNAVFLRANPDESGYARSDFASADALIDRILLERRLELMFESHERYDLIRTGRKNRLQNPDLPDGLLVLPIPQIEVDLSHGIIQQNQGYL